MNPSLLLPFPPALSFRPTRLMEYSKYNYENVKAAKDAKKKQREAAVEVKEVKMRPGTDVHDYQVGTADRREPMPLLLSGGLLQARADLPRQASYVRSQP